MPPTLRSSTKRMSDSEMESKRRKLDDTTSDMHIFDMNDDCLIKVLSFLEFREISILFEVHSRLHAAIAANLIDVQIEIRSGNLRQMEHFLRIFGRKVRKIKFSWMEEESHRSLALELITKYCNAGNVEQCDFNRVFEFDERFLQNNLTFFRGLKSLQFPDIDLENELHDRMLTEMVRIKHLGLAYLSFNNVCQQLTRLQLCQLESLRFDCPYGWGTSAELENCPRVDSLKTFEISLLNSSDLRIIRCFPNVVDLTLNIYWRDYCPLNSLEFPASLKRLRLRVLGLLSAEALSLFLVQFANQNVLEDLALDLGRTIDFDILDAVSRFTKLKSLHLSTAFKFNPQSLHLMKSLTELRCLIIEGDELKSLEPLEVELLCCNVVSSARNLNKIHLRLDFSRPSRTSNEDYHRFYEKVLHIKSKQDSKAALKVRIQDHRHPMYIETNKSVILNVVGCM